MSGSRNVGAACRAHHSLCSAREWTGVDGEVAAALAIDDETFYGCDLDGGSDSVEDAGS